MELLNWILGVLTLISGSTTGISLFMYRRQSRRFKNAEAFEKEVAALSSTVENLKSQISFYDERLNKLQELIVNKDVYIGVISEEKNALEIKHARNKSAINRAYACGYCSDLKDCPVLKQRTKNEEEYLKIINKNLENKNKS